MEWDSTGHCITTPHNRINDLVSFVDIITKQLPFASARSLAIITGRVISLSPVVGNVTRLMTRCLYRTIESSMSWDNLFKLSDQGVIEELSFWKNEVNRLNLKVLSEYKIPSVIFYSDASSYACGAF